MIVIRGNYYDGKTSAQVPAECRVFDNGVVHVRGPDIAEPLLALPRFDLMASPRLANTARYLYFPHGQKFETKDNPAVDDLLKRFQKRPRLHIVHVLESRKRYILICLVAMSAVMWAVGRYGVPAAARVIAHNLPSSIVQQAGRQTLDILDRTVFKPSQLDESVRQRMASHFEPLVRSHSALRLQIHFRKGGRVGANAFALPNGAIVLTDEMIKLSQHDDELLAVLAHEAGHVARRHGVQRIIQDSLLAFAIMAVTGDVSGTSQVFLGLPVMLTELAYSRDFEREADRYALDYLQSHQIPPRRFADLMRRLQQEKRPHDPDTEARWSNYLSTHPDMEERLRRFEAL
ncbi:MAG: M48 family metallopeptidase [Deltaproteobacteria bacterium]|nr:M48 family metallopeptidase [Deltaproteobacteria bacterium]